jgi:hypothetical protein
MHIGYLLRTANISEVSKLVFLSLLCCLVLVIKFINIFIH